MSNFNRVTQYGSKICHTTVTDRDETLGCGDGTPCCTYKEVEVECVPMMVDGSTGGEGGRLDVSGHVQDWEHMRCPGTCRAPTYLQGVTQGEWVPAECLSRSVIMYKSKYIHGGTLPE